MPVGEGLGHAQPSAVPATACCTAIDGMPHHLRAHPGIAARRTVGGALLNLESQCSTPLLPLGNAWLVSACASQEHGPELDQVVNLAESSGPSRLLLR